MEFKGWIKLYRKFYKSELAKKPPYFREVFFYLLAMANHSTSSSSGKTIYRGQLHVEYKQIIKDLSWIARRTETGYSKDDISNAMKYLRKAGIITTNATTIGTIVTICNYEMYQGDYSIITPIATSSIQRRNHLINKNEEKEKINTSKKIPFSEFWDAYDKKVGNKEKLIKKWDKLSKKVQLEIMAYLPKYLLSTPDKKYRKNPQTFLNNNGWQDEILGIDNSCIEVKYSQYEIPKSDLFKYSNEELLQRINNQLYDLKK
ncbi:hypothetical protein [Marinifilum sp. D737]|uniref:hypothetical protein n=1 Tax=Marinifilum sp. D737 TaxID=2969628 RepID=UPI002273AC2E|nr:hypothetical protein [Marinifilum sp. D737]MCY1636595.1 hypothetical protein [Marinifilum sp. D737]